MTFANDPGSSGVDLELHGKLGIRVETVGEGAAQVSMPVAGNAQISGVLHGGATCLLIEACAGYAATSWAQAQAQKAQAGVQEVQAEAQTAQVGTQNAQAAQIQAGVEATALRLALGTEVSVSHLHPATAGRVAATATPVFLGNSRTVHRVDVRDQAGTLISTGTVTHVLVKRAR